MSDPASDPARRLLFVHIGLQKTGTSYLQSIFWKSQDELRRQGLDLVPGSKRDTFNLMLRVRDRYDPEFDPPAVANALDELPRLLAEAPGPRALISEESLAPATPEQIAALMEACADREVHLVVTLRDLGRQIPSAWQQMIQSGSALDYKGYLRRLRRNEGNATGRLWSSKDVPAILERWEAAVPRDRIHLVTVPQSGGDPQLLLRRYCEVLGVDASRLDLEVGVKNESLGLVQAEVMRRVNDRLGESFRRRDVYGDIGKRFFAVRVLVPQRGDRIRMPESYREWCTRLSQDYVDRLRSGGYHVVGDLHDLMPADSAFSSARVKPREREVADASAEALAAILTRDMKQLRRRRRQESAGGEAEPSVVRRVAKRLRGGARVTAVTPVSKR